MACSGPAPDAAPAWQRTAALRSRRLTRPALVSVVLPRAPRIEDEGLTAIERHKYRPGPITPLDVVLYKVWWEPVANVLPMWLAPNAVTLIGQIYTCRPSRGLAASLQQTRAAARRLAAAVASGLLLCVCSPSLEGGAPAWAELVAFFLVMIYITCDSCDGLHARRTGACSPLGELLDHACDCVCLTWFTLGYCVSQQCGYGLLTLSALCVSWVPWWTAQWEAYHTGVVRTGGSLFGITEIELVVAGIHLVTYVCGAGVWQTPIVGAYDVRTLCVLIQLFVSSALTLLSVHNVLKTTRSVDEVIRALGRALPIVAVVGVASIWAISMPSLHIRAVVFAASALFTRIAVEMILVHMTMERYPKPQPSVVVFPVLLALAMLDVLGGASGAVALWLYAGYCVLDAVAYVADVLDEVTTHLNVSLLFIGKLHNS